MSLDGGATLPEGVAVHAGSFAEIVTSQLLIANAPQARSISA